MRILMNFSDSDMLRKGLEKSIDDRVELVVMLTKKLLIDEIRRDKGSAAGIARFDVVIIQDKGAGFSVDYGVLCSVRDEIREGCRLIYLKNADNPLTKEECRRLFDSGIYGMYYADRNRAVESLCEAVLTPRSLKDTADYYGIKLLRKPSSVRRNFLLTPVDNAKLALEYLADDFAGSIDERYEHIIASLPDEAQRQDFSLTLPGYLSRELEDNPVYQKNTQPYRKGLLKTHTPVISGKFPFLEQEDYKDMLDASRRVGSTERSALEDKTAHVHNEVKEIIREASCVEDGEALFKCEECGNERSEVIPALGHDFGETKELPASCTQDGEEFRICSRCGEKETIRIIPATGHIRGEKEVVKEPDCSNEGRAVIKCAVCGEVLEEESLPKTECDGEYAEEKAATCTEDGLLVATCRWCGRRSTDSPM